MSTAKLLTRDEFRTQVFERDHYRCVFCKADAVDAHHIMERRLWDDYGYYLDNGASVCTPCHILCEKTYHSTTDVRKAAGITRILLPNHFYDDQEYDKWGNPVMPNGQRLRGELFYDGSVQKILADYLHLFTKYIKYPRTHHLPWSPGMHDDDRMLEDVGIFEGKRVIVMEKMDGENTTMYNDYIHARSIDSGSHGSRNWLKAFHGQICANIPEDWRINVENLYAKHSILYKDLPTYAYGFAIWNEKNYRLDWATSLEWFELLGITPCPWFYWDIYDRKKIHSLYEQLAKTHETEGYVITIDEPFHYAQFRTHVGKWVRKGHIQTAKHWMHGSKIEPNSLKEGVTGFEALLQ